MRFFCLVLTAMLAGCSGVPARENVTPAEETWILNGAGLWNRSGGEQALPEESVLVLTDRMKRFAETMTAGQSTDRAKVRALFQAILSPGLLGLQYNTDATYTAAQAFEKAQANCLSFTLMLIAMARHLGLRAEFNEVDVPPVWGMQDLDTLVLYKHVNAIFSLNSGGKQVADLAMEEYDTSYQQRTIPDRLAVAQHYNNRAMEYLFEGRFDDAQRYLAKAISIDSKVSYFWSNLGAVYGRAGQLRAAEIAYWKAMQTDPGDYAAISNAARLFAQTGKTGLAEKLERRAAYYRQRNPYYRYKQGLDALAKMDYESAREHAQAAIRAYDKEHRFHFLLGAAYRQLGDWERAQSSFERAIALTFDDKQAGMYRRKMEMLMSARL